MNIIAIDIGSSNTKCCVVSCLDQKVLFHSFVETPDKLHNPNSHYYEIDTLSILKIVDSFICSATKKYKIDGLFFSTQMHGYIYATKERIFPYVSWQDSRCLQTYNNKIILEDIKDRADQAIIDKLGIPIKPSMGTMNLFADSLLVDDFITDGELYSLGSFLIHHYTANNVTHITNAAPMGIVNIENHTINYEWLDFLGLNNVKLPSITTNPFVSCGEFTINGQTIKVYPDLGDQQVSILGAKATEDEFIFNIATAAQICCIKDVFVSGEYEIRPYFDDKYLYTVTNLPAGRNLKLLIDFVRSSNRDIFSELTDEELYEKIHSMLNFDSDLHIDTDFYSRTNDSIDRIQHGDYSAHELFEGAYNDIIDKYRYTIDVLFSKFDHNKGLFLGGVSYHNDTLINLISKRLNLTPTISKSRFDIFNGLLRIALVAFGLYPSIESTFKISLKEDNIHEREAF